jgi:hypothetical protein
MMQLLRLGRPRLRDNIWAATTALGGVRSLPGGSAFSPKREPARMHTHGTMRFPDICQ